MLKLGLSSCGFTLCEENFIKLKEANIFNIEISMALDKIEKMDYNEVYSLSKKYGVNLWSFHLPFCGGDKKIDIASQDESVRAYSVNLWKDLIRKGVEIGITKFIAHPSLEPKSEDETNREIELRLSMESLRSLASYAEKLGAVIAVENLPRSCLGRNSSEILRLITAHPSLRVCFDTNHLLCEDAFEFIDKVKDKIVTLHVSGYDFVNERHWLPGEGKRVFYKLYDKLISNGYLGVWLYEINLTSPRTIIRERDLEFTDFTNNATEIFERKPLTVIGKPKPNLGFWE
jgi:sugar phosphate isomerase/epimerase